MVETDAVAELDLRSYLSALKRRRLVVFATTALVVAAALAWSWTERPRYEARARVLIAADTGSVFRAAAPVLDPNRVLQTELLVFDSPQLRAAVRQRAGHAPGVSVRQVEQTDVIEVVASSRSPVDAAAMANAYAHAYVELRRDEAVANVVAAAEQLQAKISDLQRQIDAAQRERQASLIDQQALFRQKLDQLQVDGALQSGAARLISEASRPRSPVAPGRLRIGLVALVFGLLVGIGVGLAVEYLDNSLRTVEDIHRVAPGLGVVGLIPAVREWKSKDDAFLVSIRAPTSPAAEAMRTLRTSLAFLALEHDVSVVQVTSADIGEGKSSVVANLGVALARVGRRVVVVDCDLRRPRLHRFFELDGEVGLTSVVAGEADLAAAVRPAPSLPRLLVLPAGPAPPDPSELLSSSRLAEVVEALRAQGATVILDCPPVLPVADALAIAPLADATIVVCRAGRSDAKRLVRALDMLRQVRAPLAGIVLNGVPGDATYGQGYSYDKADPARARRPVTERGA